MDRGGGLQEDPVETSNSLTDKAVVVERSDDTEFEVVVTFDKSGKPDVGELFASEESSVTDVMVLFSS